MDRIMNFVFFVGLGYVLPLIFNLTLITHTKSFVLYFGCALLLLTQPAIKLSEIKRNTNSDKSTALILSFTGFIGMIAPVIHWAYFMENKDDFSIITYIGFALIIGGLIFRIAAIKKLGKQFTATVQIVEEHQLITTGIYSVLRHPSYTGAFVTFAGAAIWLGSDIGLAVAIISMSIGYYFRITAEEEVLKAQFGAQYVEYSAKTWRLFPLIW